jgi:hypothetical protein
MATARDRQVQKEKARHEDGLTNRVMGLFLLAHSIMAKANSSDHLNRINVVD